MDLTITDHALPKLFKVKCISVFRALCPAFISFFCICVFLFLSFMIIEGYSVSRMVLSDRDTPGYSTVDN